MPKTFSYTARTPDGRKQSGLIQAEDPKRVAAILSEQQLIPTNIKIHKTLEKPGLFGLIRSRMYEDLIIFTRNLSTLHSAGIPLLRALSVIKIGDKNSFFNKAIGRMKDRVHSGGTLSEAMADFPKIFPKIYVASIEAGEYSGKLDQILDSLGVMLEKDLELNRQIKSAIRYPVTVVGAIAIAFVVLITFVIPRFVQFFSKMGADLPLPTKMLIWLNQFIVNYWAIIVAGIIISIFILKKIHSTPSGKRFFDIKLLSLPIFGDLIIKGSIARFSYIFRILLKSGIPIVKALEMLSGVIRNSQLTSEIKIMADAFREGREPGTLIDKLDFFPEMALQMIRVGLESGSLENMLEEVANHYSKEVDYKSRHLTTLLEPILTVALGVFVLIVALAIFLPMWSLIEVFRG